MLMHESGRRSFRVRMMLFFAWIFLTITLLSLGAELLKSLQADKWVMIPLGEFWYKMHVASLNLTQALIERYLFPWIWDPALTWLLRGPVWATSFGLALFFRLLAIRRSRTNKGLRRLRESDFRR